MVLQTLALTRRFGAFTAIDELTLSVDAGEVFGLLGANGAGKSTAIKMLATLWQEPSDAAGSGIRPLCRQEGDLLRPTATVWW